MSDHHHDQEERMSAAENRTREKEELLLTPKTGRDLQKCCTEGNRSGASEDADRVRHGTVVVAGSACAVRSGGTRSTRSGKSDTDSEAELLSVVLGRLKVLTGARGLDAGGSAVDEGLVVAEASVVSVLTVAHVCALKTVCGTSGNGLALEYHRRWYSGNESGQGDESGSEAHDKAGAVVCWVVGYVMRTLALVWKMVRSDSENRAQASRTIDRASKRGVLDQERAATKERREGAGDK